MKKLFILTLIACMLLCFAGCDPQDSTQPPVSTPPAESTQATQGSSTTDTTDDTFLFRYKGTEITLNAPAAPIVSALGEPVKYTESTSCAFDGLDKTYYYGSFYMDTYPMNGADYVYGWWFADDSVTTEDGIYIGAAQAAVEAAYGADCYNGSNAYIVTGEEGTLTVILEDGIVTSIQYSAAVN